MTLGKPTVTITGLHMPTLGGVVAPMVTPVGPAGEPDLRGVASLAEWLVRSGANGLFVAGTTGRFSDFTPEDCTAICRTVVDAVGKDVTVYGGVCDSGARRMAANAYAMREAGASFAVATGPYYLPRAIAEIEHEMVAVADQSPLPVIFYNMPEMLGYGLRAEWVQQISKHPNVVGYKDSSNDFAHHQAVLSGTDRGEFTVMMGKEGLLMQALQTGARGIVVSLLHADPGPFVRLMRYAEANDWNAAAEEQERVRGVVDEFLASIHSPSGFGSLLVFLEEKLRTQGLDLRLRWS